MITQQKTFSVTWWHGDESYGTFGDDPIELLDNAWDLEPIDEEALLTLINLEDFRSISFGDDDYGCSLSVAEDGL